MTFVIVQHNKKKREKLRQYAGWNFENTSKHQQKRLQQTNHHQMIVRHIQPYTYIIQEPISKTQQ